MLPVLSIRKPLRTSRFPVESMVVGAAHPSTARVSALPTGSGCCVRSVQHPSPSLPSQWVASGSSPAYDGVSGGSHGSNPNLPWHMGLLGEGAGRERCRRLLQEWRSSA